MGQPAKLRVYTDGACAFCWWSRGFVEPYDSEHRIDFRDYNRPEVAAETPYSAGELAREMHVLTPDGHWHSGFWGWIAILEALPRRRWIAQVLSLPPFKWIGPIIYQFIAANRYRVPEWILRFMGAPRLCESGFCSVDAASARIR